jgi:DNA integrity scanning protein DisA with diadenylate cyclase activity
MSDGEWLEATEDEISLMISNQEAEAFLEQLQLNNTISDESGHFASIINDHISKDTTNKTDEVQDQKKMIDELLDIYNDYKALYQMFKDPEYKDMMNLILKSLNRYYDPETNH